LLAFAARAERPQESVQVEARYVDGRSSTRHDFHRFESDMTDWYVAGSDVADLLQVGRYWRLDVRKLVLKLPSGNVTLTTGARSVVIGNRSHMLRNPVRFDAGEPWIPLEFLTRVLPLISEQAVRWDAEELRLDVGVATFNVSGLDIRRSETTTELRINMTQPLAFLVDDGRARELSLKIYGATVDRAALRRPEANGLIESISATQGSDAAFLRVELSELASSYQSLTENEGKTIVLRVETAPLSTIPDPVPRGSQLVQTLPPEARGRRIDVRRVILDPGHGGADFGRLGPQNLAEKDITLAIARELARVLERRSDLEVILTRDQDEDMGLIQRTELANRERGDLFVSIHCNGWYDEAARGVETYFLSPAKTEWDAELARAQNRQIAAAEDLDFLLWDLVQNQFVQESAILAETVQNRLSRELNAENRGVKQAGFRVLAGAYMPAVQVEVGFLSHGDEGRRLASSGYQRDIADGLAEAILEFQERMESVRGGEE
jgi:N-acetylmuramoyl-L-alanine amidase